MTGHIPAQHALPLCAKYEVVKRQPNFDWFDPDVSNIVEHFDCLSVPADARSPVVKRCQMRARCAIIVATLYYAPSPPAAPFNAHSAILAQDRQRLAHGFVQRIGGDLDRALVAGEIAAGDQAGAEGHGTMAADSPFFANRYDANNMLFRKSLRNFPCGSYFFASCTKSSSLS